MSSVNYYDELFDPMFLAEIANILQFKTSWGLGNTANRNTYPYNSKGTHLFLGHQIFFPAEHLKYKKYYFLYNNPLIETCLGMFDHITKKLDINADLKYIGANCQLYGMDGTYHKDGTIENKMFSAVLMVAPEYSENFGGDFIYLDNDQEKNIPFKIGRLIIFPGYIPHKGLSFNFPNYPRFSIKWEYTLETQ